MDLDLGTSSSTLGCPTMLQSGLKRAKQYIYSRRVTLLLRYSPLFFPFFLFLPSFLLPPTFPQPLTSPQPPPKPPTNPPPNSTGNWRKRKGTRCELQLLGETLPVTTSVFVPAERQLIVSLCAQHYTKVSLQVPNFVQNKPIKQPYSSVGKLSRSREL